MGLPSATLPLCHCSHFIDVKTETCRCRVTPWELHPTVPQEDLCPSQLPAPHPRLSMFFQLNTFCSSQRIPGHLWTPPHHTAEIHVGLESSLTTANFNCGPEPQSSCRGCSHWTQAAGSGHTCSRLHSAHLTWGTSPTHKAKLHPLVDGGCSDLQLSCLSSGREGKGTTPLKVRTALKPSGQVQRKR